MKRISWNKFNLFAQNMHLVDKTILRENLKILYHKHYRGDIGIREITDMIGGGSLFHYLRYLDLIKTNYTIHFNKD